MDESKDPQGPEGLEGFIDILTGPTRSPEYNAALVKAIDTMQAFKAKLLDHKPFTPTEVEAVLNENWTVYLYGMREGDMNQAASTDSFINSVVTSLRMRGYVIEFTDKYTVTTRKGQANG